MNDNTFLIGLLWGVDKLVYGKNLEWHLEHISYSLSARYYFLYLCDKLLHWLQLMIYKGPAPIIFMPLMQPHKEAFLCLARNFFQNAFL